MRTTTALLGILFAAGVAVLLNTSEAQSPANAPGWTQPMTPWGEPDLRGTWPIDHLIATPLERPEQYGERREMTAEELARLEQQVAERNTRYEVEESNNKMGGGHWAEPTEALGLTSLIVDPPNGRLPALTEEGEAKAATMGSGWSNTVFDTIDDFDHWDRCITRGLPVSMLPRNYNNGILIHQSPGYVVLSTEMVHESRIIPTDGRPPLDPAIKQWLGESRGRWEGNTLVIETTNFNGLTGMTNPGVPGSPREPTPTTENMRITERITRTGENTGEYTITVEDPQVMTRSWTAAYPMRRDEGYELYEYACHEDNSAVRNYIETSRFERAAARSISTEEFETNAYAALGGRDATRVAFAGTGWEACLGQAWDVREGWARWELSEYRRVTDYAAGTSSHDALRRATLDAGRAGGCGAQPDAAPAPQQGSITPNSSWAEQWPVALTPRGFLALMAAGDPTVVAEGAGWRVSLPVARSGVTYTLDARYDEQFELQEIRTPVDDSVFGDMEVRASFGPYRDFGELVFPETLDIEQGGFTTFHLDLVSAAPSVEAPRAAPQRPARPGGAGGGASASAGAGAGASEETPAFIEIGAGIFVLPGSYQGVAVEFDEFAVVIDGMQSDARTAEVIRQTHAAIPDKPIRYAVNTHSHFDHASGLRQFVADSAIILTHAINVEFFERALAAPRTLDASGTEPDRVTPRIEGVDDRLVISDASGQRLELHALAPSPHAADMLIAYLPSIEAVVESDLLQPWINPVFGGGRDGPHPYLAYLYDELERLGLKYTQFVPVHVPPEPPTMPRAALEEAVGR